MPPGSATGEFTFAALGENEKDFAELKADTQRCVS